MSTKFNRNNDNALDDEFYLGPDYRDDLNGVEEDLRDHTGDFHPTPCIISGLDCSTDDNADVDVSAGVAYDEDGYRIEIPQDQTGIVITMDDNPNWICVRHKYDYSRYPTDRRAVRTGAVWNNRRSDSFEIVVRDSGSWPQAGDVTLAKATYTGGLIVFDLADRTQPDFGGESPMTPGKVTGVLTYTGEEPSLTYDGNFTGSGNLDDQMMKNTFPARGFIRVQWNPNSDAVPVLRYEIDMVPLRYDAGDIEKPEFLKSARVSFDHDLDEVQPKYTFHDLVPAVKWRVRVRAVNTLGIKGPYSDPVDRVALLIGNQLTMSSITVASAPGGVQVSYNQVSGAHGYELYRTEAAASPPNPDPSNPDHFGWRGPGTKVFIKAEPGNTVKIVARCYDRGGRYSSNTTLGSATAGEPT